MRILVYEYMTVTGMGCDPGSPDHGMYLEGRAMLEALVSDLRQIEGLEPIVLPFPPRDPRGSRDLSKFSDWMLIVAPEPDAILANLARSVKQARGRLLGPTLEAIQLTSDKFALAEHWRAHGIPTPATTESEPQECDAFPVVWKPRDGAGSRDTFLIRDRFELSQARAQRDPARPMILQEFVPGRAASVAFLCGHDLFEPLLPTFQLLSNDGRFTYLGGELPIPAALAKRAVRLGRRAVECVPGLLGFVGVDLVLGEAEDGSCDFAIEINPRLTTSYIGLRAMADFNIAQAMLRVAAGEKQAQLNWKPGRVRFESGGAVLWVP